MRVRGKGPVGLKLRTLPHGGLSSYWLASWPVGRGSGNATPSGASEIELMWWLGLWLEDRSRGSHSEVPKALSVARIPESEDYPPVLGAEGPLVLYVGWPAGGRLGETAKGTKSVLVSE